MILFLIDEFVHPNEKMHIQQQLLFYQFQLKEPPLIFFPFNQGWEKKQYNFSILIEKTSKKSSKTL